MRGIVGSVTKTCYGSVEGGISTRNDSLLLVGDGIPEETFGGARPAVRLVKDCMDTFQPRFHVEPVDQPPEGCSGWANGGHMLRVEALLQMDGRNVWLGALPIYDLATVGQG